MSELPAAARKSLRDNNFDLIRLAAALQVVLLHSVEHFGLTLPGWVGPIRWFPGVPIFFVLSGFLVSRSYERKPNLRLYTTNRLLRIYPGLWVCFLLSIVSIACIRPDRLTVASPAQFAGWLMSQLTIGQVFNPVFLRDYGVGTLNGSLWTIPVELQFYAVVPVLYFATGFHRGRQRSLALIPLILAGLVINRVFAGWKLSSDSLTMKLFATSFVPHVWYFLVGILVQRSFPRIQSLIVGKALWWVAMHVAVCAILGPMGWHVEGNLIGPLPSLTLVGVTFSSAYTAPTLSERLLRHNDISYGTYLYHMVIVNALIELGWPRTGTTVAAVFGLTVTCAILSWKLVEQPALSLKSVLERRAISERESGERARQSLPRMPDSKPLQETTSADGPRRRAAA